MSATGETTATAASIPAVIDWLWIVIQTATNGANAKKNPLTRRVFNPTPQFEQRLDDPNAAATIEPTPIPLCLHDGHDRAIFTVQANVYNGSVAVSLHQKVRATGYGRKQSAVTRYSVVDSVWGIVSTTNSKD